MTKPLVSVCLICYNQKAYIRDCLNGIVSQVCDFQFEIVVGDDCSIDGTREIIEDFENRYPDLVKCLPKESNLGVVPNFLRTARACRGEFIAFCEGDDYWIDSTKLAKQHAALSIHDDVDIVFHPVVLKHQDGVSPDKIMSYFGRENRILPLGEVIVRRGGVIPSPSLMIRKSIVGQLPIWLAELDGCDFFLKIIASQRGGALYIPYIMAAYRFMTVGSWSQRYLTSDDYEARQVVLQWRALDKLEEHLQSNDLSAKYFAALRSDYIFQVALSERIRPTIRLSTISELRKDLTYFTYIAARLSAISTHARTVFMYWRKLRNLRRFIDRAHAIFQVGQ